MSDIVDFRAEIGRASSSMAWRRTLATFPALVLSIYFVLACASLYWLTAAGAALSALVLPRRLIERWPLPLLAASSLLVTVLTQATAGFLPDYGQMREIAAEVAMWAALGLLVRCYLIYTAQPDTFAELQRGLGRTRLDRWFAGALAVPVDAVFSRIWIANSVALVPISLALFLPSTMNYLVIVAYSVVLLLVQFPHELMDHTNIHNRIFSPRPDAPARTRRILEVCRLYYENVLAILAVHVPQYYRIQHVYVHHVEDNGPRDTQTTMPYDRTSFADFSRHALRQGVDLVSGYWTARYLKEKGKQRQLRELLRGLALWYAFLLALALINPWAAAFIWVSRLIGGNILSLIAFFQHGLIDARDVYDVHGNSIDYHGPEHGNLGNDYHVEHHLKPARHWSTYFDQFSKEAGEAGHKALVVEKSYFGPLAFVAALWRRDFDAIARHADLRGVDTSDKAALAAIIRERTRPIGERELDGLAGRIDRRLGRAMAWVLPTAFRV